MACSVPRLTAALLSPTPPRLVPPQTVRISNWDLLQEPLAKHAIRLDRRLFALVMAGDTATLRNVIMDVCYRSGVGQPQLVPAGDDYYPGKPTAAEKAQGSGAAAQVPEGMMTDEEAIAKRKATMNDAAEDALWEWLMHYVDEDRRQTIMLVLRFFMTGYAAGVPRSSGPSPPPPPPPPNSFLTPAAAPELCLLTASPAITPARSAPPASSSPRVDALRLRRSEVRGVGQDPLRAHGAAQTGLGPCALLYARLAAPLSPPAPSLRSATSTRTSAPAERAVRNPFRLNALARLARLNSSSSTLACVASPAHSAARPPLRAAAGRRAHALQQGGAGRQLPHAPRGDRRADRLRAPRQVDDRPVRQRRHAGRRQPQGRAAPLPGDQEEARQAQPVQLLDVAARHVHVRGQLRPLGAPPGDWTGRFPQQAGGCVRATGRRRN